MVSASSVRLIRELSDASDFDIFLVPSRNDITRVAGPRDQRAHGRGKKTIPSLKPWPRIERPKSLVELLRDIRAAQDALLVFADPAHGWRGKGRMSAAISTG